MKRDGTGDWTLNLFNTEIIFQCHKMFVTLI